MANFVILVDPDAERRAAFLRAVRGRLAPVEGLETGSIERGDCMVAWAARPGATAVARAAGPAIGAAGPPIGATGPAMGAAGPAMGAAGPAMGAADPAIDAADAAAADAARDSTHAPGPKPAAMRGNGGVAGAVLWGYALDESGPADAAALERGWARVLAHGPPACFDGYHAAVVLADGGLVAGTDVLGLFPLYYAQAGPVLIAGSSPRAFAHHPLFPPAIDPDGLAGVLLSGGPVAGQTMLRGVRRLGAGNLLVRRTDGTVAEAPYYRLPGEERLAGARLAEQVRALDAAFADAVERHAQPRELTGMLLSGGLDSRLLAGYLALDGQAAQALTFGLPTDHDARFAAAVARELGFHQRLASLDPDGYPPAAWQHARWEQLGTAFASMHMWGALASVRSLPPRFLTGYFMDVYFRGRAAHGRGATFDQVFGHLNDRGVAHEALRKLLAGGPLSADAAVDRLRDAYDATWPTQPQRGWRYQIAHSERNQTGTVPWRLTFASWPVLPILDRRLLETIALMPAAVLSARRLQLALLRTRFPSLARLPLDRNSNHTAPVLLGWADRLRQWAGRPIRAGQPELPDPAAGPSATSNPTHAGAPTRALAGAAAGVNSETGQPIERRYFHRIFDFDGPGWKAVRREAEPHRARLEGLLNLDALNRFLPPPGVDLRFERTIPDSNGHKQLIGLLLWAADHLP